jgi:hypothetical protein|tara:strand:+ start:1940 stop:2308 length:369 start_codon:yes stop_codon:yes gene_type:complete
MSRLLLLLLLTTNIVAQEFITSSSFDSKTAKGTVVIEFYAEWNDGNKVKFLPSLKDCNAYRVDIVKQSKIQKEFKITSVPTVIVLNNGVEEYRFISNIMLQLDGNKKKVQSVIDDITFEKFQ